MINFYRLDDKLGDSCTYLYFIRSLKKNSQFQISKIISRFSFVKIRLTVQYKKKIKMKRIFGKFISTKFFNWKNKIISNKAFDHNCVRTSELKKKNKLDHKLKLSSFLSKKYFVNSFSILLPLSLKFKIPSLLRMRSTCGS